MVIALWTWANNNKRTILFTLTQTTVEYKIEFLIIYFVEIIFRPLFWFGSNYGSFRHLQIHSINKVARRDLRG